MKLHWLCCHGIYVFQQCIKETIGKKKLLGVLLNSYWVWEKYVNRYIKYNVGYASYDIQEV